MAKKKQDNVYTCVHALTFYCKKIGKSVLTAESVAKCNKCKDYVKRGL